MKILHLLAQGVRSGNSFSYIIGGGFVSVMALVTLSDVIGRYFRKPLPGALEMSEVALVAMVVLTWAHTQAQGRHVFLDMFHSRFPRWLQILTNRFTALLGLVIGVLIVRQAIPFALKAKLDNEWTEILHIPLYPFMFLIAIGAVGLCCQFVLEIFQRYRQVR